MTNKIDLSELTEEELAEIGSFLNSIGNSVPFNRHERERAFGYSTKISIMRLRLKAIERKREAISKYFHNSKLHPAIRQMSADRVNQSYDNLVEQGKIKEGEN